MAYTVAASLGMQRCPHHSYYVTRCALAENHIGYHVTAVGSRFARAGDTYVTTSEPLTAGAAQQAPEPGGGPIAAEDTSTGKVVQTLFSVTDLLHKIDAKANADDLIAVEKRLLDSLSAHGQEMADLRKALSVLAAQAVTSSLADVRWNASSPEPPRHLVYLDAEDDDWRWVDNRHGTGWAYNVGDPIKDQGPFFSWRALRGVESSTASFPWKVRP